MSSVIKDRTISSVVDKRVQLKNSSCARLWSSSIGTSWTKVRVAARITITDSGAALTGTPKFAFGMQSGAATDGSNLFLSSGGPVHWFGIYTSGLATWNRAAGPPVLYGNGAVSCGLTSKKIGTTITSGANAYYPELVDATTAGRGVLFLDVTKGSPNFTLNVFARTVATSNDVDLATYLAQVVLDSPTVTNHTFLGAQTLAIDEATNGFFNAVGFAWNRSDALIELSDVTVVKLT
jgi:hypothetical protein